MREGSWRQGETTWPELQARSWRARAPQTWSPHCGQYQVGKARPILKELGDAQSLSKHHRTLVLRGARGQRVPFMLRTSRRPQAKGRPPRLMKPLLLHAAGCFFKWPHKQVSTLVKTFPMFLITAARIWQPPPLREAHGPTSLSTGKTPHNAEPFLSLPPARYTLPSLSARRILCFSMLKEESSNPERTATSRPGIAAAAFVSF